MLSSLFLAAKLLLLTTEKIPTPKITIMSRDIPLPPLPDAPSAHCVEADALNDAFNTMLLNQTTTSNDKFSGHFGSADAEDALAPSRVDERRLKDCIGIVLPQLQFGAS